MWAIQIANDWAEATVTWANQPATTGSVANSPAGPGYRQWNVTSQVQAMHLTGAHHGFLIRDAAESSRSFEQQFHSKEKGETPPLLEVRFADPPVVGAITHVDSAPPVATGPEIGQALEEVEQASKLYLPIAHRMAHIGPSAQSDSLTVEAPAKVEQPGKIYLPIIER
jgi:hypothetical protein